MVAQRTTLLTHYWKDTPRRMNEFEVDDFVLQVCAAVLTQNHELSVKLAANPAAQLLPDDIRAELCAVAIPHRETWLHRVVRLSYYTPAWVQFLGQRLVLLSPRLGHWVLRKTRIHHRWY